MWFRVASERTLPRGAIRALFDAAGLKLSRAMLVKWGPIALPRDLPRGRSRALEGAELDALYALAGRDRREPPQRDASARGPTSAARSAPQAYGCASKRQPVTLAAVGAEQVKERRRRPPRARSASTASSPG